MPPRTRRSWCCGGRVVHPALVIHSAVTALPYVCWPRRPWRRRILPSTSPGWTSCHRGCGARRGRADLLRTRAQPLAPLLFGAVSDYIFGGGTGGLRWTLVVMLLPVARGGVLPLPGEAALPGRRGGRRGPDQAGRCWCIQSLEAPALTLRPGVEVRPKPLSRQVRQVIRWCSAGGLRSSPAPPMPQLPVSLGARPAGPPVSGEW
jgi:hypothetical protein